MNWDGNLLEQSAVGALMIVVVLIFRRLWLHRLPKQTFIVLWGLVWVRLLVPVSFAIPWPTIAGNMNEQASASVFQRLILMTAIPEQSSVQISPVDVGEIEAVMTARILDASGLWLLSVVWLIGCISCALFLIVPHLKARRIYRESLPVRHPYIDQWRQSQTLHRSWTIRQSDQISMPLTYGWIRPVLLLPASMDLRDESQLALILQHEFIHIRRMDVLKKGMLVVALCVHWFNPLVWLMYRIANRDIELACDEAVVRAGDQKQRAAYALTLLRWQEQRNARASLGSYFSKHPVEERVVAIMNSPKRSMKGIWLSVALVVCAALIFVTFATDRFQSVREREQAVGDSFSKAVGSLHGATNERMPHDISFSQDDVPYLMGALDTSSYRAFYVDANVYLRVMADERMQISYNQGATWSEPTTTAIEGEQFAEWLLRNDPIPGYSMKKMQARLAAGANVTHIVLDRGQEIYVISDEQGVQLELVQERKVHAALLDGERLMLTADRLPLIINTSMLRSFYDLLVANQVLNPEQASLDYSDRVAYLQRVGLLDEKGQSAPVAGTTISSTDGRVLDVSLHAEGKINFSVLPLQQGQAFTFDVHDLQSGTLEIGLLSIETNQTYGKKVDSGQTHVSITVPESGDYRIYLSNLAKQRVQFQLELEEAIEGPIV